MEILKFLHVLGVIIWVGGMFFAYMALRPVAAELLEPSQRLKLWQGAFGRFFPWVWFSVTMILVSGLHMVTQMGGLGKAPLHVQVMFAIGIIMMAIFAHVFFASYKKLKRSVKTEDWHAAGLALAQIRFLIELNLTLGIVTTIVAIIGPSLR